jgi:hypothetical protein
MGTAIRAVLLVSLGAALAAAHAGGLACNVRLYGARGVGATAVVVHGVRTALLVAALRGLTLWGASALMTVVLAFAGSHAAIASLASRRP